MEVKNESFACGGSSGICKFYCFYGKCREMGRYRLTESLPKMFIGVTSVLSRQCLAYPVGYLLICDLYFASKDQKPLFVQYTNEVSFFAQSREARRLREFLEDYDDERDDPKFYK